MNHRFRRAAIAFALLGVGVLACSPGMVAQGILGDLPGSETATPQVAQLLTPIALSATATGSPIPSVTNTIPVPSSPTLPVATSVPTVPPATNAPPPTSTNAPVLPLRTDLPPMALRDFPRPANDNGRCFHFLPTGYFTPEDMRIQIERLKGLQSRWVLALYADENQLKLAATQFKAAGIIPVWRKTMRAYQRYYAWDRDIKILKDIGLPPYFQIYNEPDIPAEWDDREINRDQWVSVFVQTAKDVYNAGGYPGIQVLDEAWLLQIIQTVKAQKGDKLFTRSFFIPHPYGLNHPPNYVEDENGVLGYRIYADMFQKEIGYVPPFIAGEGGWKFGAGEDNRFPSIDDKLHALYHVELFDWFRLGKVSDGQPLPDYLFAFCPWILAGQMEGAAWYDSFEGNRETTIAAVKKIPIFTRKFTWDKK